MSDEKSWNRMGCLGALLGYAVFAGLLVLWHHTFGHQEDSNDFYLRLLSPISFRFRSTDFLCYVLVMFGGALFINLGNSRQ